MPTRTPPARNGTPLATVAAQRFPPALSNGACELLAQHSIQMALTRSRTPGLGRVMNTTATTQRCGWIGGHLQITPCLGPARCLMRVRVPALAPFRVAPSTRAKKKTCAGCVRHWLATMGMAKVCAGIGHYCTSSLMMTLQSILPLVEDRKSVV